MRAEERAHVLAHPFVTTGTAAGHLLLGCVVPGPKKSGKKPWRNGQFLLRVTHVGRLRLGPEARVAEQEAVPSRRR